jgi:cell division protein ZapA (FtsZ GTPase activity inhibitor)
MKEAKEVTVSINNRVFTIDIAVEDEELIETIFSALKEYVKKGFSIKVKEAYVTSLSDSLKIISKIIASSSQIDEWRAETKQLISIIRKGE